MTTATWSTRIRHDSDGVFREWGSELSTKFGDVGLVQTSDTGQINWTTVTRATVNTDAGYEIWRFNDTPQSTAPIYFRIDYGTDGMADRPRLNITVGTGSNGSGTITGTALTSARTVNGALSGTTDTVRASYMCAVSGLFWFSWKVTAVCEGSFYICRTCDTDGVADTLGAQVYWGAGVNGSLTARQSLRFAATAAAYGAQATITTAAVCINPLCPASSAIGSDYQVFLAWTNTPRPLPMVGVVGVVFADFTAGSTFSATPVGSTARTYFVASDDFGPIGSITPASSGGLAHALIWE